MKIIFSRKGFDSINGGYPSPIFPNGKCYSIPIPGKNNIKKYQDLDFQYDSEPIQSVLNDLTKKSIKINGKRKSCDYFDDKFRCHSDPLVMEEDGIRFMTLGQVGAALGYLKNKNVQKGDIFLFFGLYREIDKCETKWKYKSDAKKIHLIYSYMKIDNIVKVDEDIDKKYQFLKKHPHFDDGFRKYYKENYIFVGHDFRIFDYDSKRVLTDMDSYKGVTSWKLPINFDFSNYISNIKNIKVVENNTYLQRKGPGQEFVLDLNKMTINQQKIFFDYLGSLEVFQGDDR